MSAIPSAAGKRGRVKSGLAAIAAVAPHVISGKCRRLDKGRVSRVPPVQTTARNCTRDGGGPSGIGNQVPISSHRKLRSLKAMVVSVAEKPDMIRQARLREASASKPLMKCRKEIR
jgi:hypothetical protein